MYAHEEIDDILADLENRLEQEYERAVQELTEKQLVFLKEYDVEVRKIRRDYRENKITERAFEKKLRDLALDKTWYEDMLDRLSRDAVNVDKIAAEMVRAELPYVRGEAADYSAYTIEQLTKKPGVSFSLYNPEVIKVIQVESLDPRVDEVKDFSWWNQKLTSELTQGILQGETMGEIAARFAAVTIMSSHAALRTARTAVTGAENAGRLESYRHARDLGIDVQKQWRATLDKRTRSWHRVLDQETRELDEPYSNGLMFPGDTSSDAPGAEYYNCRCHQIAVIDGETPSRRRSNLGDMSYQEWREGKPRYESSSVEPDRAPRASQKARMPKRHTAKAPRTKYTMRELKEMERESLLPIARQIAADTADAQGITPEEAQRRFDLLIDANTTPQVRRYINRYGSRK